MDLTGGFSPPGTCTGIAVRWRLLEWTEGGTGWGGGVTKQEYKLIILFFERYRMGGNCSCASGRKQVGSRKSDYSQCPDDIKNYTSEKRAALPKLKFEALLYNIVIIDSPKSAVSLKFEIEDVVEVLLPRKSQLPHSNEIKWIVKQKFNFILDEYDLRLKFLTVSITEDQNKTTQQLKINLYKIATGPYHNDFAFLVKKTQTRLKFDFKVSQYVELKINCLELIAELNEKSYPGESFHFTIRVLKQQHEEPFESNPSYAKMNPYQKSQKSVPVSQYDQCPSPIKIKGKQAPKPVNSKCSFEWSSEKGEMPNFTILIKSDHIQKTILHLVVWRAEGDLEGIKSLETDDHDVDMFCQAHISALKILQQGSALLSDHTRNQPIQRRELTLEKEGLWSDGEKIGHFSMKLRAENNKFIKQMKACTRTQAGIIESTPLFRSYFANSSKEKKMQKSTKIEELLSKIQSLNKEMNQNKELSYYNSQKLKDQMIEQFEKIKKICETDLESSFYVPSNQEEACRMIEQQNTLLSIVWRVMDYAEDNDSLTDVCWRIINVMLKRGEFQLSNIGFSKSDQLSLKNSPSAYMKKKVKIALEFQEIQYKLLLQSLRIGYIEGREDPRQAVEMFRAYAYFRVPCYRQIILRKVVRKEDSAIEWNTNITDEDIETMPEAQSILSTQLDWDNNFYKPLAIQTKSESLTKQMLENLEGSLWLEQISKRGSTFFYFLYFLISKLTELGKRIKFIKWQYFPGYNKLVRAFLLEMKNIKIERYPPSMVQTSINLLNNEKLLNILMSIVFEKTNANDPNGSMKGLDLISRYLNHFSKNKKLLPPSFNYVHFFKAVKIVLEGEFAYSIAKTLSIIYMNYDNFNVEFRRNLSFYLLGGVFFKLFLNWSFTIRKAFYHVLILKIQRASDVFDSSSRRQFSNKHQIMNQISNKYHESLKIVRSALQVRQEDSLDRFRKNDKQLFKVLKRKMAARKRKVEEKRSGLEQSVSSTKRQPNKSRNFTQQSGWAKLNSKYSLQSLAQSVHLERSNSVMFDRQRLKSAIESAKRIALDIPNEQEEQAEVRTRSGTSYKDALNDNEEKETATKPPRRLRERKRSIYGMDEFEMREIDQRQIEYLGLAVAEFDDLDAAIRKYYMENSELPICELDVEVPIDEKEIKPLSADFEEWQASENFDQS